MAEKGVQPTSGLSPEPTYDVTTPAPTLDSKPSRISTIGGAEGNDETMESPWTYKPSPDAVSDCSSDRQLYLGDDDSDSGTTSSADSLLDLPFVEKMPAFEQLPDIPHYRLILSIDHKIEAATYQTPFGPVIVSRKGLNQLLRASPTTKAENNSANAPSEWVEPRSCDVVSRPFPVVSRTRPTSDVPCPRTPDVPDMVNEQTSQDNDMGDTSQEPSHESTVSLVIDPLPHPETFSNGFFEVRSSATAGYGAFALKDITRGQTILIEKALFHATYNSLYDKLENLEPSLKEAFGRMHAHVPKASNGPSDRRVATFKTNSFVTSWSDHAVFLTASRFNHACKPINNVTYIYDPRQDCIVFSAEQDTKAGEELFICYGKDPANLYSEYGFVCKCGGCRSLTVDEVHALDNPIC